MNGRRNGRTTIDTLHRRSDHFGPGQNGSLSGRYGEEPSHYVDPRTSSGSAGSGPHRGKGPKNFARSDERLRELACEALSDDSEIDATDIEVDARSGEIILRGTVEDRRIKRLAEDCVSRIPGIADIQNQLRIAGNRWQAESRGNQVVSGTVTIADADKKHRA